MTVCDYRHAIGDTELGGKDAVLRGEPANVDVAVAIDVEGFFDLLTDTLALYE
jgi:inosine-uridine nucleoside N-ribohydrolase